MRAHAIKPEKIDHFEEKKRILTKAFIRTTEALELSRQEISMIVGPSESSLSRIFHQKLYLDPSSKEGQFAVLLIRLYRSLDTLLGGNVAQCRLWLRSENDHLGDTPIHLIQSIEGLIYTIQYLDAMRGKN